MIRKLCMLAPFALAACAANAPLETPRRVATAVDPVLLQASSSYAGESPYRIGPADKLALRVFQVEDLSFSELIVDASGNLALPLIGTVRAAGKTPAELSAEIAALLRTDYLRNPQVSVNIVQSAGQKVTVDGAVTKPGIYELRGPTTLLQAVAMAEGPTRVANLRSVAVFRNMDGRPMVAVFNLQAIRSGRSADPLLRGDDIVVVDTSRLSARMQDLLQMLPAVASFVYYTAQ